jgi:hypothetical protein
MLPVIVKEDLSIGDHVAQVVADDPDDDHDLHYTIQWQASIATSPSGQLVKQEIWKVILKIISFPLYIFVNPHLVEPFFKEFINGYF